MNERRITEMMEEVARVRREYHKASSQLESVTTQLGEFMLLNKDVEGIDLSSFHEQASKARDDIAFYASLFVEAHAELIAIVKSISL